MKAAHRIQRANELIREMEQPETARVPNALADRRQQIDTLAIAAEEHWLTALNERPPHRDSGRYVSARMSATTSTPFETALGNYHRLPASA